jgi:hypothetical protein
VLGVVVELLDVVEAVVVDELAEVDDGDEAPAVVEPADVLAGFEQAQSAAMHATNASRPEILTILIDILLGAVT